MATYRELMTMISTFNEEQMSSDITVEIPVEGCPGETACYPAYLSITDADHDGGLEVGHPVIVAKI